MRKFIAEKIGLNSFKIVNDLDVKKYLNLYLESYNWSRDKIENYQINRLKMLLKYAYKNVEFYRKRFDEAGFNYESLNYLDQLNKIPILTRVDLQSNTSKIISKNAKVTELKRGSSSGSTGLPVLYYHDKEGRAANKAAVLFSKIMGGYNLGDPWLNIWGNPTAVNVEWKKINSRISKYIFNEVRFPAYKFNSSSAYDNLLDIIINKKPIFIYGYTNAIFLFARYLKEKNIRLDFIKGVFVTAENLLGFQRKIIKEHIGHVFNHYGCSEINGIAAESLRTNDFEILDTHVILELKNDLLTNKEKIVLTDLHNKEFPLIRYENDDLGAGLSKKGSGFSRLKSLDGRLSDIIITANNSALVVPSFFGSRMLKELEEIKQYQVTRVEKDLLKVNIVAEKKFNNVSTSIIKDTLEEYIPKEMRYTIVYNEPIEKSKNGKIKLFIDKVKI